MKPPRIFERELGESHEIAYVFDSPLDWDAVESYFESQGDDFSDTYGGVGGMFSRCSVWQGRTRTIAYIQSGLDI